MASLNIHGSQFSFESLEGEQVLLDCSKLLSNKSRISMHRLPGQAHPIIPEVLMGLIQHQQEKEDDFALPFGLIDTLLTARLIHSAKAVKVLEYGSGQGELSFHLAELLGTFHHESTLVCAHDSIEPEWMERISQVVHLPKLSFLAGDFGELRLQEDFFDIVLLNGLTNYERPAEVIADAMRLSKNNGILICYASESPLLESCFKLHFETREEYVLTPSVSVIMANATDCVWKEKVDTGIGAKALTDMAGAKALLNTEAMDARTLLETVQRLQEDVLDAASQGEVNLKIELLKEKEKLLNLYCEKVWDK